jgi:hypothetical protein
MIKLKAYGLMAISALLLFFSTATPLAAEQSGRYQAIEISLGKKSEYHIFILDTKDGHMWLLETEESRLHGKLTGDLRYHGQLRPGKNAGEILFTFGISE